MHLDHALLRLGISDFHRAPRDLAALDDEYVGLPGFLANRAGGDDRRLRGLVEDDLALGEHAALERPVAIGHGNIEGDRARSGIRDRVDALDPALEHALAEAVHAEACRLARTDRGNLGSGRGRLDLHAPEVDQREERAVDADFLTGVGHPAGHDAREGRAHRGVVHRLAGDAYLRFFRFHRCNPGLERAVGGVERVLRDELLAQELQVVGAVLLGDGQLRLRLLEGSDAGVDLRLQVRGVDLGHELAGGHSLALAHQDAVHFARHFRLDRGLHQRRERPGEGDRAHEAAHLDDGDIGGRELQRHGHLLVVDLAGLGGAEAHQGSDHRNDHRRDDDGLQKPAASGLRIGGCGLLAKEHGVSFGLDRSPRCGAALVSGWTPRAGAADFPRRRKVEIMRAGGACWPRG